MTLHVFADLVAPDSRVLVERFSEKGEELFALLLTTPGGLALVQVANLSRRQVESLRSGLDGLLGTRPDSDASEPPTGK